jgi:hypoxanthine phosphoribosyltransferase
MISFIVGVLASVVAAGIVSLFISQSTKFRVPFRSFKNHVSSLASKLNNDLKIDIDLVIGINRSGLIVASILAGRLGRLNHRTPSSIDVELKRINGLRTSTVSYGPTKIACSKVLLVGCTIDTGSGLAAALEYLKQHFPDVQIVTAALYVNPRSLVLPDFVGKEVDASKGKRMQRFLTQLPWIDSGWTHDLPSERGVRF